MLQSVMSRLAFFCALALLILAVPAFYFMTAEARPIIEDSKLADGLQSSDPNSLLSETSAVEEPVVKLASLTVSSNKPILEILEPLGSLQSDTMSRVERASTLAQEQNFEEALTILDGVHFADREDYAVKFLEARVLAWAGQHERAEGEFEKLRAKYPQDLDILVSFGYLRFYQRDYALSEDIFTEVLEMNPDYGDARIGLERSRLVQNKAQ